MLDLWHVCSPVFPWLVAHGANQSSANALFQSTPGWFSVPGGTFGASGVVSGVDACVNARICIDGQALSDGVLKKWYPLGSPTEKGIPTMQIYKDALNAIAANDVQAVNEISTPSYTTIKELKGAGYVTALDSSADDGNSFMKIEITLKGRQYLEQLSTSA